MTKEQLISRYFRKVISNPGGTICHDGDCYIFASSICTCGLLHSLTPNLEHLYPKYEVEYHNHLKMLEIAQRIELPPDPDQAVIDQIYRDAGFKFDT